MRALVSRVVLTSASTIRGNYTIRMICPIKINRGLGPSKVLLDSRTYSVDFPAHKLELTPGLVGDGSAIYRHDHLLPEKGCRDMSPRASFGLLALGESP
jgi:hypothetical protein